MADLKFSIITPSFGQHDWLRLCAASVADQADVELEHIVQDGGDPGAAASLQAWAGAFPRLRLIVEKDGGMYDAINRGLRRATGDICAYLNCDEQYLPGALAQVSRIFLEHPELDLAFGDALVVDAEGRYLCHRQSLTPRLRHTVACHFSVLSCVVFFRRRLVERGLLFDPAYRIAGDADWMARCLQARVRLGRVPHLLAAFTDTGSNLGLNEKAAGEARRIQGRFPAWWTWLACVWAAHHRLRRWRAGYYRPAPVRYALYTRHQPQRRTEFNVPHPTFLWKGRVCWNR